MSATRTLSSNASLSQMEDFFNLESDNTDSQVTSPKSGFNNNHNQNGDYGNDDDDDDDYVVVSFT